VLSLRCLEGQLVKGQQFPPGLQDAPPRAVRHFQSTHPQLGDLKDALVVGDRSNDDGDLVLTSGELHVASQPSQTLAAGCSCS